MDPDDINSQLNSFRLFNALIRDNGEYKTLSQVADIVEEGNYHTVTLSAEVHEDDSGLVSKLSPLFTLEGSDGLPRVVKGEVQDASPSNFIDYANEFGDLMRKSGVEYYLDREFEREATRDVIPFYMH